MKTITIHEPNLKRTWTVFPDGSATVEASTEKHQFGKLHPVALERLLATENAVVSYH